MRNTDIDSEKEKEAYSGILSSMKIETTKSALGKVRGRGRGGHAIRVGRTIMSSSQLGLEKKPLPMLIPLVRAGKEKKKGQQHLVRMTPGAKTFVYSIQDYWGVRKEKRRETANEDKVT